ncbi:hypothetical protein BJQ97_01650 [Geobacillus sp. TFV-3]|nr:hypothetical protein BJQ97_01650 [Geobacillus sp. TFV-3]
MFGIQLNSFAHSSFVNPRRGCRWLNAVSQPRSTKWVFAEAFLPSSITNIEAWHSRFNVELPFDCHRLKLHSTTHNAATDW